MHPAKSVILFTTTTGAGYGLAFLLMVGGVTGLVPPQPTLGGIGLGVALALITLGLLTSTFHLGHPERAWRALSQWRSSWLSREGVAAVLTYGPVLVYGAGWVGWGATTTPFMTVMGVLGSLGCVLTVVCTAMIYRSLKPVHAWANSYVPATYLILMLATGGLLLNLLQITLLLDTGVWPYLVLTALFAGWVLKLLYWRFLDTREAPSTPETATGLGGMGTVRMLDAPHSAPNYLMKEMVFQLARRHALTLRRSCSVLLFALPIILTAAVTIAPGGMVLMSAALAVLFATLGIAIERWLFFAEAKHTVGLYYGARAA